MGNSDAATDISGERRAQLTRCHDGGDEEQCDEWKRHTSEDNAHGIEVDRREYPDVSII